MSLQTYLDRFLVPLDDPGSRLFHVNLLMTMVFIGGFIFIRFKVHSFDEWWTVLKSLVFRRKYWWNASTKIDYQIYFLNGLLKTFLFIPWLDFSYFFSKKTVQFLQTFNWNIGEGIPSTPVYLFLFTLISFVFDDFLRFFHHWCMHKIPILWRWHQTHHSAKILTPITLFRAHPMEVLISTLRNSLSAGISVGCFVYLFEAQLSYFQVLSVNMFGFVFNFLGSNLRHSHIPIRFGFLETIFISPRQHQIHHSQNPEHFDKNFGVSLSIWDRLSGNLVYSQQTKGKLSFGLRGRGRQSLRRELTF